MARKEVENNAFWMGVTVIALLGAIFAGIIEKSDYTSSKSNVLEAKGKLVELFKEQQELAKEASKYSQVPEDAGASLAIAAKLLEESDPFTEEVSSIRGADSESQHLFEVLIGEIPAMMQGPEEAQAVARKIKDLMVKATVFRGQIVESIANHNEKSEERMGKKMGLKPIPQAFDS